ncbi:hypothetical protein [Microlunatus ginsengisoli]|uniref:Uncharacterized protein n=1 Tax=Microlunatus ginsengisoli TaxID=363863 RepID=A0ABP7AT51_9ACTN
MRAVVPLNIAGLRVSNADDSGLTSNFAGRTAMFDKLPYQVGTPLPSTGDQIWRSLDQPAAESLKPGIHLHWELPEYFKRGVQDPATGQIRFPAAPNRWLVSRTLRIQDPASKAYGPPQATAWIVESDYLTGQPPTPDRNGITRLPVAVPLQAPSSKLPYLYMGRVVGASDWNPSATPTTDYLPSYKGADKKALYLTSIGFAGASFSGYYPDCRTVFGYWDTFEDVASVFAAISAGNAITFAASYAVTGWLADETTDPLTGFAATVTTAYDTYVAQCTKERVPVAQNPAQVFCSQAEHEFGWLFDTDAVSFTLNADSTLDTLTAPTGTLCAGTLADIVWNGPGGFLAPSDKSGRWTGQVQIAAGNTTAEAVAALVASQLPAPSGTGEPVVLETYETLLEALQLGLLRDLESDGNALVGLGRARHDKGFSSVDGGHLWTVQTTSAPGQPSSGEVTLPLTLAEQLAVLNQAQAAYDRARTALVTLRQQLFMDWVVYVQLLVAKDPQANAVGGFLTANQTGELKAVQAAGAAAGLITYQTDPVTGAITGVTTTSAAQTTAGALVAAHQQVVDALAALAEPGHPSPWELDAVPAPAYWMPTDPVLVIEGDRIEPARRNGPDNTIAVRTDAELVDRLTVAGQAGSWTLEAAALTDLAAISASVPAEVLATLREAALIDPQRSAELAALAGSGAPSGLTGDVSTAVGGQSPLDPPVSPGLFGAVRTGVKPNPARGKNPSQTVGTGAGALTLTFTNAGQHAYAPDPVGWNTQQALPEFSSSRFDPYLPVWMRWSGKLDPLAPKGSQQGTYDPATVTNTFDLDATSLDFGYQVPARFTTGTRVDYGGEVVLSKTPMQSLIQQIDGYQTEFATDPADPELTSARNDLAGKRVMSQALDTFGLAQTLRQTIPQLPVMDLTVSPDIPTANIAKAANATPGDSWYDGGFNALQAIPTGPQALGNFGPLRAGFFELESLFLVDVFGQPMSLNTATHTVSGALSVTPAGTLAPEPGDTANAQKLYLPPRLLTPARVEAHWLSADFDDAVPGIDGDFLESGDQPASSPVCGWLVPNHLDTSLMCYNADGRPVGSFVRIGAAVRYQTVAGNTKNPRSDLTLDVGPAPQPGPPPKRPVNEHLAELMWFLSARTGDFLTDLLATIDASGTFIAPTHAAQDVALSVLIGRPLAIVRFALGLSPAGGTLPVNQSQAAMTDAIKHTWTTYADRQAGASAALGGVQFAITVGDHSDLDDGLVALLPESSDPDPYTVVLSSAAVGSDPALKPLGPVDSSLGATQQLFTALIDPRAPIHLTSGVLPTQSLQIPPGQYVGALRSLGVTFTTRPVLSDQLGLRLPLPAEPGYLWSWVAPGEPPLSLPPTTQPESPVYGHGPQTLTDGWLLLQPDPEAAS